MSRTIEESCLSNPSFISSSNVLRLVAMLVMTLLMSSLINIQTVNAQVTFGFKFGTYGQNYGQFYYPQGVAVDSTGKIYVSDANNDRIEVFSASAGTPEPGDDGDDSVGGCSMADGSVNAEEAVANVLIPLIPVFAIGIRMIRRRVKKRSLLGGS